MRLIDRYREGLSRNGTCPQSVLRNPILLRKRFNLGYLAAAKYERKEKK